MNLLTALLRDLYWRDQFAQGQAAAPRMDRDRYLLAFSALLALVNALGAGSAFLFPLGGDLLMDKMTDYMNLMWSYYSVNILIDPLLIVICVVLARRMFGVWLMLPVGLLNYGLLSVISIVTTRLPQSYGGTDHYLMLSILGICAGWTLVHLYVLFQPSLKAVQPQHPLLWRNPQVAENGQLTALQFMWRMMALGLAAGVLLVAGIIAFFDPYSLRQSERLVNWSGFVALLVLGFSAWLFWLRLRNLGWKPVPVIALGIVLPVLLLGSMLWCFFKDYFGNPWLFLAYFLLLPWLKLGLGIFHTLIVLCPAPAGDSQSQG